MTKQQVLKAIQEEIKYCQKNKKGKTNDFAGAFIAGLYRAFYLVREMKPEELEVKKRSHKKKI